jgi:membrane protein YdbS with pleckstrin-like domain
MKKLADRLRRRTLARSRRVVEPEVLRADEPPCPLVSRAHPPDVDEVWYDREFELSVIYPQSLRFSLRKSFWWLVSAVASFVLFPLFYGWSALGEMNPGVEQLHFLVVRILLIAFVASMCYWELYRWCFVYKTAGFRLLISRGVCIKVQASLPLIPVTELVLRRSPLDVLWGLYVLDVVVPVESGEHLGTIEGLSRSSAFGLQQFLGKQLNNQIFVPDVANVGPMHPWGGLPPGK